jgi:hypothetical protein
MFNSKLAGISLDAFFDGITGAALFGKLTLPGSPTKLIDSRSPAEAQPDYDALLKLAYPELEIPKPRQR